MAKQVRIAVDYENSADAWWDAAHASPVRDIPVACRALGLGAGDKDSVTVSREDAEAFLAWAEKIPGWGEGPEHAEYPFTFHDVE